MAPVPITGVIAAYVQNWKTQWSMRVLISSMEAMVTLQDAELSVAHAFDIDSGDKDM